jgi:FtsH-binding integral membrane protein
MKTIAWLTGIGTLLASAAYMVVSLNRWEWNRALFFGLILLVAEVGLSTGLILRKLGQLASASRHDDDDVATAVRETRPSLPNRFEWLKNSSTRTNVFITFAVAGGVLLSGLAWVVDRLASATANPVREAHLIANLQRIAYPSGGLLAEPTDPAIAKLLRGVA